MLTSIFLVTDLAARFSDRDFTSTFHFMPLFTKLSGRLSTKKLIEANDEELAEMLIEVRGIGRVSVPAFCMHKCLYLHSGRVRATS
jgi:hypothetical protein